MNTKPRTWSAKIDRVLGFVFIVGFLALWLADAA